MTQVKIYGHAEYLQGRKKTISDAIQEAAQEALGLPNTKRFHRFFSLQAEDFIHPSDHTVAYLILEICLFQGRSPKTLENYIRALQNNLGKALNLKPNDVEITLIATPPQYWGIRGQLGHELQLSYEVSQ